MSSSIAETMDRCRAAMGHDRKNPPPGLRRSTHYVPEVESLRGIAILLVLFHHVAGLLVPHLTGGGLSVSPLQAFVAGGQTGVSLFFVLSAFCLSLPFFTQPDACQRFSLREFYRRRALRILPLYWSVLLLATIAHAQQPWDLAAFVPYAFFLNSIEGLAPPLRPFTYVVWSLATEAQFYLLLPLLPFTLRSPNARYWGTGILFLYGAMYIAFLTGHFPTSSINGELSLRVSVLGRGPLFLTGIAVAWLYARHGQQIAARLLSGTAWRRGLSDLLLFGVLSGLGCLLRLQVAAGYSTFEARPLIAWHAAEGLLWGAALFALLVMPLKLRRLACNPLLGRAGILSFSIYLVHLPMLVYSLGWLRREHPGRFETWSLETAGALVAILGAILLLSSLTYRWIESPFLKRKAKIGA